MNETEYDNIQRELSQMIQNDAPCTIDEPIPVLVTLDNGVEYKGVVYEVQPISDDFPNGLIMVRTATTDLGVPVTYISAR